MSAPTLELVPDTAMALTFCRTLFGNEPTEFRDIHPHTGKTRHVWGYPETEADFASCVQSNREGYGVFAVINRADPNVEPRTLRGKGTRDQDITGIRALSVEIDKDEATPGGNLRELLSAPLKPSLIVRSSLPHKLHAYWLVADLPLAEFKVFQVQLIDRFGAGPESKNLSRVLRVPGFYHTKGEPVMSLLEEANGTLHTRAEFIEAFGLKLELPKPPAPSPVLTVSDHQSKYALAALHGEAQRVAASSEGGRNDTLNKAAFSLGQLVGAGALNKPMVEGVLLDAALTCGLDQTEARKTIASGLSSGEQEPRDLSGVGLKERGAAFNDAQATSNTRADTSHHSQPTQTLNFPSPLDEAAYHGLAGRVVRTLEPHSEADPVALLINYLASFGNAVGVGPYVAIEGGKHSARLFANLVGESSKARKGTSWSYVKAVFKDAAPEWAARIVDGMSSGEGLIWAVRDPIVKKEPVKKKGEVTRYQEVITDHGEADKRLMVVEGEFARVLRVLGRDGNTLSPVLRSAWDSGDLRTLTKASPAVATGAHISIVGHITRAELLNYLTATESANGFGNRFIWLAVRRSKHLPFGGNLSQEALRDLANHTATALQLAQQIKRVSWGEATRHEWVAVYPALSEAKPGLLGSLLARSEAQVLRLALTYALLDHSATIEPEHLHAALALWEYSERSAAYIFGAGLGDPTADTILDALKKAEKGLTRTDLSNLFGRHKNAEAIQTALELLESLGLAHRVLEPTEGRTSERWLLGGAN